MGRATRPEVWLIFQALSIEHEPGPVMAMAVVTATIEAQYSHPPFGRNMKYPTRPCTVAIATDIRAITAMHARGVANPMISNAPAMISVAAAINA